MESSPKSPLTVSATPKKEKEAFESEVEINQERSKCAEIVPISLVDLNLAEMTDAEQMTGKANEEERERVGLEAGLNHPSDPMPKFAKVLEYANELKVPINVEAVKGFGTVLGSYIRSLQTSMTPLGLAIAEQKWSDSFEDRRRFSWQNLAVSSLLDEGRYGKIFKARMTYEGIEKTVLVKQFQPDTKDSDLWKARDMLISLKHKRVINLHGAFYEKGAYFVLENCYGSLQQLYKEVSPLQKVRFSIHLLEALQFLHGKRIIHTDVCPNNCFLTMRNTLVLANFTNAQILSPEIDYVRCNEKMLSNPGFSDYAACIGKIYSEASDIFGAACCIYLMDTGLNLCLYDQGLLTDAEEPLEYARVVRQGRLIHRLSPLNRKGGRVPLVNLVDSSEFAPILKVMISDAYRRPTAVELLANPVIQALKDAFKLTDASIEEDADLGSLIQRLDQTQSITLLESSPDRTLALHMIYYQEVDQTSEENINQQVVEHVLSDPGDTIDVTQVDESNEMIVETVEDKTTVPVVQQVTAEKGIFFDVVRVDVFKEIMGRYLSENAVRVFQASPSCCPTVQHQLQNQRVKSSSNDSTQNGGTESDEQGQVKNDPILTPPKPAHSSPKTTHDDEQTLRKLRDKSSSKNQGAAASGRLSLKRKNHKSNSCKTGDSKLDLSANVNKRTVSAAVGRAPKDDAAQELMKSDGTNKKFTRAQQTSKQETQAVKSDESNDFGVSDSKKSRKNAAKSSPPPTAAKTIRYGCNKHCKFVSTDYEEALEHKQQCEIWYEFVGLPREREAEELEKSKGQTKVKQTNPNSKNAHSKNSTGSKKGKGGGKKM